MIAWMGPPATPATRVDPQEPEQWPDHQPCSLTCARGAADQLLDARVVERESIHLVSKAMHALNLQTFNVIILFADWLRKCMVSNARLHRPGCCKPSRQENRDKHLHSMPAKCKA